MHQKEISIADFTYILPPERIAQHPLTERDQSRLLVYEKGKISDTVFSNLVNHLPENSTLIFNDTKVIHARLVFKNENDAAVEVFLLEPVSPYSDMQLAIFHQEESVWRCFVGNAKKWREEKLTKKFRYGTESGILEVRKEGMIEGDFLIHLKWNPENLSFATVLQAAGYVPLPPYIKRKAESDDEDQYQTVYAIHDGSVAAPTAGLHFTEKVFDSLKEKNIQKIFTTLHVSAGTFLPVKSKTMEGHAMHQEQIVIQKETMEKLLTVLTRPSTFSKPGRSESPIVCVGTTSLRTIESLYWLGRQLKNGNESLEVDQWEPYQISNFELSISDSLEVILEFMEKRKTNQIVAQTKLLIAPGYKFKFADGLITNFHLPQSTLLLLIAAFIGDDWRKAYDYALKNDFRFLSYGDASLLWRNTSGKND